MADTDRDAIEQLLREIETGFGSAGQRAQPKTPERGAPSAAAAARRPSGSAAEVAEKKPAALAPWEHNPYADAAEQERLQNLANVDALLGNAPAAAPEPAPQRTQPMPRRLPGMSATRESAAAGATEPKQDTVAPPNVDELLGRVDEANDDAENSNVNAAGGMFGIYPQLEMHAVRPAVGSVPPPARSDHTAVPLSGARIVFFGGISSRTHKAVADCSLFDAATGGWEPVFAGRGDPPSARSNHAAAAVDLEGLGTPEHMVVIGGCNPDGAPLADVHLYDVEENAWTAVNAEGKAPAPRCGHSAAAIGARVFVFGGRYAKAAKEDGDDQQQPSKDTSTGSWHLSSDMYVLDLSRNTWSRYTGRRDRDATHSAAFEAGSGAVAAAQHPAKRFNHASCASSDGTAIFIHGGIGAGSQPLSDLWKYDVATRAWLEIARPNGIPRARHSLFYVDEALVAVGGASVHRVASRSAVAPSAVASVTADSPGWQAHAVCGTAPIAPSRAGAAIALLDGVVYAHGGVSPSEPADVLSQLVTACVAISTAPRSVPCGNALAAPLPGVAALTHCFRRHVCPFDLAIDCGDGPWIGCHQGVLRARAPRLLAALLQAGDPIALSQLPPHFASYAIRANVVGSRGNQPLAVPLNRAAVLALLKYLYTAQVLPATAGDEADAAELLLTGPLLEVATAYDIEHLLVTIRRFQQPGVTSANSSPSKGGAADADDVPTPLKRAGSVSGKAASYTRRRVEAHAVAVQHLATGLEEMCGDSFTTDAKIVLRPAGVAQEEEAVTLHAAIGCGRSPTLRRIVHGLLQPTPQQQQQQQQRRPSSGGASGTTAHTAMTKSFVDRSTGLAAMLQRSVITNSTTIVILRARDLPPEAVDGTAFPNGLPYCSLPSVASAVRAAVAHMYCGGAEEASDANALETLLAAKVLELPELALAAQRRLAERVDAYAIAGAMDAPDAPSPSELIALLQLAETHAADHVISRVAVAAAAVFDSVAADSAFGDLPPRLQHHVRTVAAQTGHAR